MSASDEKGASKSRSRNKSRSPHYRNNNEGGFGNPPVKSQFKAGGKGGPGRTKGETTLESEMRRMLRSRVKLADGKTIPVTRGLAMRARKEMLNGSLRAVQWGMELAEKYNEKTEPKPTLIDMDVLSDAEMNCYGVILNRLLETNITHPDFSFPGDQLADVLGTYRIFVRDNGYLGIEKWPSTEEPEDQ